MDLKKTCDQVIDIVRDTGAFIFKEAKGFDWRKVEYKGTNDMVSYVDKQAEKQLVSALGELIPEAGFIAEEGTGKKVDGGYNWIIDPLDGTTNFIHGIPVYSVSVALQKGNELLVGVIYDPNQDECFHAFKEGGAFLNEQPIRVSPTQELSKSLIGTGFPYEDFGKTPAYLEVLVRLLKHSHGIRRIGSAAIDLAYVACGRFEGFFEYKLKPWDVAAGILLVEQAGGKVTDFSGEPNALFGGEILAAAHVHKQLLKILADHHLQ